MRIRVVMQCRLTSSRLPGKAMLTLAGRPLVALAAGRAANTGHDVVVATSTEAEDDVIANGCAAQGIRTFRGSLDDPLDRFAAATTDLDDGDLVVRLTGDNCVIDGTFVAAMAAALVDGGAAYSRVADGYPHGLGCEVFTVSALRDAAARATDAYDREHVTPWLRRTHGDTEFAPSLDEELRGVRCTIDTLEDYVYAVRAWGRVGGDPLAARWRDLLREWSRDRPAARSLPARANAIGQGPWVLGTVQLGGDYGAANTTGQPPLGVAREILREAARLGVTHLDTAAAYGTSEERVGTALAQGAGPGLAVVTKVRPLDDVPLDADPAVASGAVGECVERSLRRLRAGSVDGLLVHRWADWQRGGGEVARRLDALRQAGTARVVGASLSTPEELLEALADERVGYVQLPFNLLDRRWTTSQVTEALAARPDVVVTVRSVFLQGILASATARWPANDGTAATVRGALDDVVRDLGRSGSADLALAYVRSFDWVTSVVLGAETPDQVRDQGELLGAAPLTAQERTVVHDRLAPGSPVLVDPSQWKA